METNSIKGKKILITGITGFIGNNLAKRLSKSGAIVYGISKTKKGKNIFKSNILDYAKINRFIKESKIDSCIHLAGEALVELGQKYPYNVFKTNIVGTLNTLEAGRKNKLEKIIIASTSHVYGKNTVPYFERYTPKPSRPYETSKACADLVAQSYADSYSLPVLIPRFVNVYGPGDMNFDRLIPKTVRQVLQNKTPLMWGGDALRNYLFIEDAIDAYICLLKVDISEIGKNRIFNFGSNSIISVRELIEKIIRLAGKKLQIKSVRKGRENEIKSQYVSLRKTKMLLKWSAKTDIETGLNKTIAWYSNIL